MSVLSELQEAIRDIPEHVLMLLRQEATEQIEEKAGIPEELQSPALRVEMMANIPDLGKGILDSVYESLMEEELKTREHVQQHKKQFGFRGDENQKDFFVAREFRQQFEKDMIEMLAVIHQHQDEKQANDTLDQLQEVQDWSGPVIEGLEEEIKPKRRRGKKDEEFEGDISTSDNLAHLAGSLHSEELDVLEQPGGSVVELLTRIANAIEALVERSQSELGGGSMRGRSGGMDLPEKMDVGWSLMPDDEGITNSASPSIEPSMPRAPAGIIWRPGIKKPPRRRMDDDDDED